MDIELYYEEQGSGFPLILLHGNNGSGEYFKRQLGYFSDRYRVIAVDTRGHGKSPRGGAPFTIDQFADDLRDFMDGQSIDRAHILGFSDGANIAMSFALKYPERVDRLILNGGNLCPKGVKRSVQIPIEIGYRTASLFASKGGKALRNKEMLGLMVNCPHISPEQLKSLTMRTLVIAGDRDMIKDSHTRLIFESLPDAELSIVKGDHFIAEKVPEEFNRRVAEFLDRD